MSSGTGRTLAVVGIGLVTGFVGAALLGPMLGAMAFGVGYMGGSFIGQMIFPVKTDRGMPQAADYPMQRCDKGSAVPVTYGTLRVAGNIVWMGPLSSKKVKSGGKGGGGDSETRTYRRSFLISVCEGERDIIRMWKGKHEVEFSSAPPVTEGKGGNLLEQIAAAASAKASGGEEIIVFSGDGVNEGLAELIGEDYSQYKHDCCALYLNYSLGYTQTIPMFTYEVTGTGVHIYQYPTLQDLTDAEIPDPPTEPTLTTATTAVSNALELQAMTGSGTYYLTQNIDLTGVTWTPITSFAGVLDGRGYTISNLTINDPTSDQQGLFGTIAAGFECYDLTMDNCSVTGRDYVAILAGDANANATFTLKNVNITNSTVTGTTIVAPLFAQAYNFLAGTIYACNAVNCTVSARDYAGGLLGYIDPRSTATGDFNAVHCTVTGTMTLTGHARYSGGFVGYATYASATRKVTFHSCSTNMSITVTDAISTLIAIGGFAGYISENYNSPAITVSCASCYATGDISITALDSITSVVGVGGFVGFQKNASYANCYSTGDITIDVGLMTTGWVSLVGGFGGKWDADYPEVVLRCYATGNIVIIMASDTVWDGFGGFIGGYLGQAGTYEGGIIRRCWSEGDVTISSDAIPSNAYGGGMGGFIGYTSSLGTKTMVRANTIENCYAWGSVKITLEAGLSALTSIGGFIGAQHESNAGGHITTNITNCYCAQTDSVYGSGYTGQIPDRAKSAGFVGLDVNTASAITVTECFFDQTTSSHDSDEYAEGHHTLWMMTKSNYTDAGWDFDTIWYHPDGDGDVTDANPAEIIYDLCTQTRYGAGMPTTRINMATFLSVRDYCNDNDLLISVAIDSSRPLLDWIQYICSHFGGFMYWQGSEFCFGAWRDDAPEFHITRDHLVVEGDAPPVQVRKRKYSETCNHIEMTWQNREDIYGPSTLPVRDDVDIRISGKRRKQAIQLAGIKRASLASKMAWRYLIDSMYRFGIYSFRLGYKDMLLHVGQVGLLTDGFRITDQRIRITSISESKDGKSLDIEAVDDISNLYPDLRREVEVTKRTAATIISVDDLADAVVETRENTATGTIDISIAPGNEYVEGWAIYTSWDDNTYTHFRTVGVTELTAGETNSSGTLLSALPAAQAPTWRGEESFTVDIGTATDLKTDITAQEFFSNTYLAKVDDEIIAYRTCEETDVEGQWTVTELIRGLYQTEPVAHSIGATFQTLNVDASFPITPEDAGKTLYIKTLAIYQSAIQDPSDVTPVSITIPGSTERPFGASLARITSDELDGWQTDYTGDSITLYWNLPGRKAGWNIGGQDGDGTWEWGDSEGLLVPQNGVVWGAYQQDADLQGVDLVFRDASGTLIGSQTLGVVSTATISKTTDLGGNNPAEVEVWPRYAMRTLLEASATIDDGT